MVKNKCITLSVELIDRIKKYNKKTKLKISPLIESLLTDYLDECKNDELSKIQLFLKNKYSIITKRDNIGGCIFFKFNDKYIQVYAIKLPDHDYLYSCYVWNDKEYKEFGEFGTPLINKFFENYDIFKRSIPDICFKS